MDFAALMREASKNRTRGAEAAIDVRKKLQDQSRRLHCDVVAPSVASTSKDTHIIAVPTATLSKIPKKQTSKEQASSTPLKSAAKAKEKLEMMKTQKKTDGASEQKKLAPVAATSKPTNTSKSTTSLPHSTRLQSSNSVPQPSANAIKRFKERQNAEKEAAMRKELEARAAVKRRREELKKKDKRRSAPTTTPIESARERMYAREAARSASSLAEPAAKKNPLQDFLRSAIVRQGNVLKEDKTEKLKKIEAQKSVATTAPMRNTVDSLAKIQTEQKRRQSQQTSNSTPTTKPKPLAPVPKHLLRNIDEMSAEELKEHIARMQGRLKNIEQSKPKPRASAPTSSRHHYNEEEDSEDSMDSFIDDSEVDATGGDERTELKRTLKELYRYDSSKYAHWNDRYDDRLMEVRRFRDIDAEDRRAARAARMEEAAEEAKGRVRALY